MTRRLPSYLRVVEALDDQDNSRKITAPAPCGSAKTIIAVATVGLADASRRAVDAALDAIRDETFDVGLHRAFDDMRGELGDLIARRIQLWIVKSMTTDSETQKVVRGDAETPFYRLSDYRLE
jgi:hypothetical protein